VNVPVIASGGVGTLQHLVDGVVDGGADAVLAASIFHFREHTIADANWRAICRRSRRSCPTAAISSEPCTGHRVPVVAACTGHALAAGALILLGCDVRIAGDVEAKVGLNEVAIKMVLPGWALTIATDRLSKRHFQRAIANARITTPREAVDVGFVDEVVPDGAELERAVAVAAELASTLDPSAYARTVRAIRGPVLDVMAAQIAADRSAGASPV
jgi:hypothetical protein